jgi:uncharacterized protein (DUF488 family)
MSKLYTIGHSTRTLDDFIDILHTYQISHLVDVRSIPKSGYVPWFNEHNLKKSLQQEKIVYIHMPKLGGLRKANKNSINLGWHNVHFRGFADYMQTPTFFEGLKELNNLIKNKNNNVVIMCAEALPWRCHRSLIADAEIVRHTSVLEIISKTSVRNHQLTDFALIDKKTKPFRVYYPKS